MDSLTPDKDDLERFRQERKKVAPTETKSDKAPTPAAAPKAQTKVPAAEVSRSQTGLIALLLVLLIVVAGVSFWQIFRQQSIIDQIRQQLTDADQTMNQSKLVIARLEGNLNETEASVTESGNQLVNHLNKQDAEIRKLWDATDKRNLDLIKQDQGKISTLETALKKLDDRLKASEAAQTAQTKTIKDQQTGVDAANKSLAELQPKLTQWQQETSAQLSKLTQENQALATDVNGRIEALKASVAAMPSAQKLEGRVKDVEAAIQSIDASRRQINQRIVDLEQRVNETQLKLNALAPTGPQK